MVLTLYGLIDLKKEVDELDSKPNQIAENLRQAILKF